MKDFLALVGAKIQSTEGVRHAHTIVTRLDGHRVSFFPRVQLVFIVCFIFCCRGMVSRWARFACTLGPVQYVTCSRHNEGSTAKISHTVVRAVCARSNKKKTQNCTATKGSIRLRFVCGFGERVAKWIRAVRRFDNKANTITHTNRCTIVLASQCAKQWESGRH